MKVKNISIYFALTEKDVRDNLKKNQTDIIYVNNNITKNIFSEYIKENSDLQIYCIDESQKQLDFKQFFN